MIRIRDGAALLVAASAIRIRDGGGSLVRVASAKIRDGAGNLVNMFSSFSVSVAPGVVNGYSYSNVSAVTRTETVTATLTGGTGPFAYAWSRVGTGGPAWTINNAAGSRASFSVLLASGESAEAQFKCTVTDSFGDVSASNIITALADNYGGNE